MANLDNCKFVTLIEGIQKPVSNMYAVVSCVVQVSNNYSLKLDYYS